MITKRRKIKKKKLYRRSNSSFSSIEKKEKGFIARKRKEKREHDIKQIITEKRKHEIEYNPELSEGDIQSILFSRFLQKNYDVRCQYKAKAGQVIVFFDLIIFKDKKPVCIVEVKKNKKMSEDDIYQNAKYNSFDCEILYCFGEEDIDFIEKQVSCLCGEKYSIF